MLATTYVVIPFTVLIEFVRNIIRPFTLSQEGQVLVLYLFLFESFITYFYRKNQLLDYSVINLKRAIAWRQGSKQRTLTYFVRGNITVWLTSCLIGLDSAVWLN